MHLQAHSYAITCASCSVFLRAGAKTTVSLHFTQHGSANQPALKGWVNGTVRISLFIYLSICLSTYLPIYLPIYVSIYLYFIHLSVDR